MSQDYTNSKPPVGGIFPLGQRDNDGWSRVEPLITPEQVKSRWMFGIPMYSVNKDPVTGKRQPFTDEMIKDEVVGAVSLAEMETGLDLFPVQHNERLPFNRNDYLHFGYVRTEHRPIASIEGLYVTTSNGSDVFTVPIEWIETGYLTKGQINLIPMGVALNLPNNGSGAIVGATSQSAGGAAFLAILGNQHWIPAFWRLVYTTGFPDGMLPRVVNDLIGAVAAQRVLSKLGATNAGANSASLGIDGLSQSVSTPGPNIYQQRIAELGEERKLLVRKLKTTFGLKLFSGDV